MRQAFSDVNTHSVGLQSGERERTCASQDLIREGAGLQSLLTLSDHKARGPVAALAADRSAGGNDVSHRNAFPRAGLPWA